MGILSYVFLISDNRMIQACFHGEDDAEDVYACTKLIAASDGTDMPILAQFHLHRAQKYVRLDQHVDALPDLDRAIALDDSNAESYTQRAIVYSELGDYEAALPDFESSLRLAPSSRWALHWHALTLFKMKRYQEALDGYEAALVIDPEYIPSLTGRSRSLSWLGRSDEAIQATTDILEFDPENLWALQGRANMLANVEQFESAIENIERYIQINPNHSNVHVKLASYLEKIGEIDAAAEALDRAIELNPESVSHQIARIGLWLTVENYEQMAADAERAYARFPNNDDVLASLFTSYLLTGQDALADEHFNIWAGRQSVFLNALLYMENSWGQNHPIASVDTQLHLFKGFIFAQPLFQRTDLAKTAFESYFEAGGPDSVRQFQRMLDEMGLYRGDFTGIYDDRTSTALSACIKTAESCFEEWQKSTAL
jgi:tetratricopeptide (TPR) repeat protein